MVKGYYDVTGSDYLNGNPSVSKETPLVPEHNHDAMYYQKEEVDNLQQGQVEAIVEVQGKVRTVEQTVTGLRDQMQEKAPLVHTHDNASTNKAGFMSVADKQKLDAIGTPTARTQIHVTTSAFQGFLKETANKILFNTILTDAANEFNTQTNSVKLKESGMYLINSVVEIENTSTVAPRLFLQVYRNGVQGESFGMATIPVTTLGGVSGSTILPLTAGDVIDIRVWSSQIVNTRARGNLYEYLKITRIW